MARRARVPLGRSRTVLLGSLLVPLLATATACAGSSNDWSAMASDDGNPDGVRISPSGGSKKVDPEKPLRVSTEEGKLSDVSVRDTQGRVIPGELSSDGARWHNSKSLAAGQRYTVQIKSFDEDGHHASMVRGFRTGDPKHVLKTEISPADDDTVGVGQPIVVKLSKPMRKQAERRTVEGGLRVTSKPGVTGSWHWVNNTTLHYRSKEYWPANAEITVRSALAGVRIHDQLYGAKQSPVTFHTGDRVVAKIDAGSDMMTVRHNNETARTVPITAGKPGFATRNGTKVVLGKQAHVRMRSASIGIGGGSEYYDLPVQYAVRVTQSGEFVHAAPWSVGAQGRKNSSHGCVGMSTANGSWFFNLVKKGDLVTVVNSSGSQMEPFGNGFGDWNLDWEAWQKGSALHGEGKTPAKPHKVTQDNRVDLQPVNYLRPHA